MPSHGNGMTMFVPRICSAAVIITGTNSAKYLPTRVMSIDD